LDQRRPAVTLPPVVAQAFAAISLGLLGVAGAAKLVDPDPTSGALREAGLPAGKASARLLGAGEAFAAVMALTFGGLVVAPASILYLGFGAFTLWAVRGSRPIQSCGCFGREDTPPSWLHVAYNATAVVALAYLAVTGRPSIPWTLPATELVGYAFFALTGVFASYLLLSSLPQTLSVARGR
jgi:hypothetical protein